VLSALEEFDFAHTILTAAHLQVLSSVPTLRRLRSQHISADALTSLVHLPQLDTLSIHPAPSSFGHAMALDPSGDSPFNRPYVAALCAGLGGLSKLTTLTLHCMPFAALGTILASTPRLRVLSLLHLLVVDEDDGSFDCSASFPTLESLCLWLDSLVPMMIALASLNFSVEAWLTSFARHTPKLRSFHFTLPRGYQSRASNIGADMLAALPTLTECRIQQDA
jgi:hypothetical protein